MWNEFDKDLRVCLRKEHVPKEASIIRENVNGKIITHMEVEYFLPEKTLKRSAETTVASSKRQKVPNDVHYNDPAQQELQVANANPILDSVETDDSSKQSGVKKAYAFVKKLTGTLGGSGSHGPIYGELTQGSMQKMVNLMKDHTGLDSSSFFIDVGSGIGKPNFHVANDPGVQVSLGLEVDANRWLLSMNCLLATLDFAAEEKFILSKQDDTSLREQLAKQKCIFIQGDIEHAKVFDPFTHVYMFSIGFPPDLWVKLAGIWNRSASPYLICFHAPKDIVESYGFDVELLAQTQTSMHGSNERGSYGVCVSS
jgi:Histone methylation protein DOT1